MAAPHQLGDGPIEAHLKDQMIAVMKALDEFVNGVVEHHADRKTGIVVMMFPLGEAGDGRCNFISNGADRRDLVVLFKEMVARFEGQPAASGRA